MRIIDLHCYPNTRTWREEADVAAEFTEHGIEACAIPASLGSIPASLRG